MRYLLLQETALNCTNAGDLLNLAHKLLLESRQLHSALEMMTQQASMLTRPASTASSSWRTAGSTHLSRVVQGLGALTQLLHGGQYSAVARLRLSRQYLCMQAGSSCHDICC